MLESNLVTIERTEVQIVYTGCTFYTAMFERFEKSFAFWSGADKEIRIQKWLSNIAKSTGEDRESTKVCFIELFCDQGDQLVGQI